MYKPRNPFYAFSSEELATEEFARKEDAKDALSKLRNEFVIPTKADLRSQGYGHVVAQASNGGAVKREDEDEEALYFCGNSLGLQPKRTKDYVTRYLETWSSKAVFGHFKNFQGGLPPWMHLDDAVKEQTAKIVGALPGEVVIMETLTANLHLLMSSFYKPTKDRWKIIIEGKAFPSDHYAALSQIAHHNLPPSSLVCIEPPSASEPYLSNEHILSIISQHAASTALVLLPGIQFYSGQYFDIELITRHCHSLGITVGWDLAHAIGNVPLKLHDWNVDFAAWCNYKYMNGGPGVIGGLFVHDTHGKVEKVPPTPATIPDEASSAPVGGDAKHANDTQYLYRPRLSGWWGSDKSTRFLMQNKYVPIPGASGFQLSNPSALDMTAVMSSLDVFALTTIDALRQRSIRMTSYLEMRLLHWEGGGFPPYKIITPANPNERGAQLSVLLNEGLLESVLHDIEENGVVVDERKPDVLRIAPAPLFNSYLDIHRLVVIFQDACKKAVAASEGQKEGESGAVVKDGGSTQ